MNDYTLEELRSLFASWGFKPFRALQVFEWIHRRRVRSFEEMTNLSKADRAVLEQKARVGVLEVLGREQSSDRTEKWLLGLEDGHRIETVLIPDEDRWTQCISTQVGCAMGCAFCRTAGLGFKRHLKSWEIVEQIAVVRREFRRGDRVLNVVLMGMGEPLANYDAVVRALRLMLAAEGLDLSKRRITLSTCGLLPEMIRLMNEGLDIQIAVSLNASTDEQRSRLMPINRKYPLKQLIDTCRNLPLPSRNRITFEYILLKGVNDSPEDAKRLVKLLHGLKCKVNLILHNPFPGSPFEPPSEYGLLTFKEILTDAHITTPIRQSRGSDISAACGQLAGKSSDTDPD